MSFTIISDYNLWTQKLWYDCFSDEATVSMAARHGQHNGLNDLLIYTHIDRGADTNVVLVPFLRNTPTVCVSSFSSLYCLFARTIRTQFHLFFSASSLMIHLLMQTACLSLHFPIFISILCQFFGQQTLLVWLSSYANTFPQQSPLYYIDHLDDITLISFLKRYSHFWNKTFVLVVWTRRYRTFEWAQFPSKIHLIISNHLICLLL